MSAESISTKVHISGTSPFPRFQTLGHLIATTFVVLVLLSAAGLKIHASLAASADSHRVIAIAIALGEILMSSFLLLKRTRNLAWVAAGCLFASFAVFNWYQWLVDNSSCGCFGNLALAPANVLFIDLSVLLALITFPPAGAPRGVNVTRVHTFAERIRRASAIGLCGIAVCVGATQATNAWVDSGTKEVAPGVREGRDFLTLTPYGLGWASASDFNPPGSSRFDRRRKLGTVAG